MGSNRLAFAIKAINQLGPQQVGLFALYKFGLATGHYRRAEKSEPGVGAHALSHLFPFPTGKELLSALGKEGQASLLAEADEIVAGKVRLFGTQPVDLKLALPGKLNHWTAYETGKIDLRSVTSDIKLLWEPARFGWAFTLGRAFHLSGDEKYAGAFWQYFETFMDANPPCLGPHWMSGQEVALRLMAFAWAGQVFDIASASTLERKARLAAAVAAHAARIPPTLVYARSQHNNHLLTEAAGLLTAGLALPDHSDASRWRSLGWHWLNQGIQSQIDSYGEYAQHSSNYHRLMLQVVLWANALIHCNDLYNYRWPHPTLDAIKRSVHWLLALLDSESSRTPNLGANDGAYIFPLTVLPFADYRPVLHAAARAFLEYDLPHGSWDEMALWFGTQVAGSRSISIPRYLGDQLYGRLSWAYFRTAQFTSRPSHADQLHLDLWWCGLNVTQDAGTYLYNAESPWDNGLASTRVHNTVAINGRDQMTRAGRFLYLDWVNAYRQSLPAEDLAELQRVRGRYRGSGYRHTRIISVREDDRWLVVDEILPLRMPWQKKPLTFRLHWLLPDWEWKVENQDQKLGICLESPHGMIQLNLFTAPHLTDLSSHFSIVRAGELLHGSASQDPVRGWTSPAYGVKVPALSLAVETTSANEVKFFSEFIFPK